MLAFPNIDPVIFSVGPLAVRWYSLAYIGGILFGWYYARRLAILFSRHITAKHLEDFVTWSIIGIVAGGRLGYVIFYNPVKYLLQPVDIIKTLDGGMSFHGGIIGLILATYFFSRKHKIPFLEFTDLLAAVCGLGLFFGRIANFINAELWGRITDVPWAVIFPGSDNMPRHPSQLYEALGEGLLLFIVINYLIFRYKTLLRPGLTSGIFLVIYAICRMIAENFREPDIHLGFIYANVTMGQLLCLPMLLLGLYLMRRR
jgi:phosphatidylglycerol:prolipoprotein diacylglycerol transferase